MPNHVVNHISLQGDPVKIREMLEAIQSDEAGIGSVDFNKIIPMPESLGIEAGSQTDRGLKAYRDFIEAGGPPMTLSKLLRASPRKARKPSFARGQISGGTNGSSAEAPGTISGSTALPPGTSGAFAIGEPNGTPTDTKGTKSITMTAICCISRRHGLRRIPSSKG